MDVYSQMIIKYRLHNVRTYVWLRMYMYSTKCYVVTTNRQQCVCLNYISTKNNSYHFLYIFHTGPKILGYRANGLIIHCWAHSSSNESCNFEMLNHVKINGMVNQLAVYIPLIYTTYIYIYCLLGGYMLPTTYHLLWEPETTVEKIVGMYQLYKISKDYPDHLTTDHL